MSKNKISRGTIRLEIKAFQKEIKESQGNIEIFRNEIEKVQEKCPHDEKWKDTTYYWAPGHGTPGKACNICGKFESSLDNPETTFTTFTTDDI
jgi:hypothetical protein